MLIVYTAAFGGRPNGAMLSHAACFAQGLVYGHFTGASDEDVYLNSGPLFHLGTLMHTLATFVFGGTNVFVRRVDGDELCRDRSRALHRCVPRRADLRPDPRGERRWSLRPLQSPDRPWAAGVGRDDQPRSESVGTPPGGYGQSEVVGMMTYTCLGIGAAGTHGRTSPLLQIRVVDDEGADVPAGDVGEIVTKGPTVMNGYWNRPDENARRTRGGWHHTNDLGRREPDGSISFIGPATRMIKSAAENIYPAEVERCIAEHPAVAECAVIGVPDAKWVQKRQGDRGGASRRRRERRNDHRALSQRDRLVQEAAPRRVCRCAPRQGFAVDYDALDAQFGGGNYPGGRTRSA